MKNARLNVTLMMVLASAFVAAPAFAQTFPAESQWIPLQKNGVGLGDVRGDAAGGQGERDLVGDATNAVGYIYQDATHLFFRLRIDGNPTKNAGYEPFGWGCAIDTDGDFSAYEFLAVVDGILNPDQVQYRWNQNKSGNGVLSDPAEVVAGSWAATTHSRTALANTTYGGDADYFLSWAVPLVTMRNPPASSGAPNYATTNTLRIACGTSNNAQRIDADPAGVNGSGAVFADIISDPIKCTASSCTACNVASACGRSCVACTGGTPACDGVAGACVRCVTNSDCPTGATCSSNTCSLAAPTIASPANASQTNVTSPTVSGSSAPGASVSVIVDNAVVGTATANASGSWSLTVPMALGLGSHTVRATATVGSGNLAVASGSSATSSFTIIDGCLSDGDCSGSTPLCETSTHACVRCLSDGNCPTGASCTNRVCVLPAPVIAAPASGSTINNSSPAITGTAPAHATVTITLNGTVVGSVGATAGGTFSFSVPTTLAVGNHSVTATATAGAGAMAVTSASSSTSTFSLISGCLSHTDCAGSTPSCRVSDNLCVRCLATSDCPSGATCNANACSLPNPAITSVSEGATINDATPTITGVGQNGATVTLWVDGQAVGSAVVAGGTWSITPAQAWVAGPHQLAATAKVGEGALEVTAQSAAVGITLVQGCLSSSECAAPSPLCKVASNKCVQCLSHSDCPVASPVCVPASNQCVRCAVTADCPGGATCTENACVVAIPTINSPAEGVRTRDLRPAIVGTSLPGATITFYVDDVVVGTAVADGAGAFAGTPTVDLTYASHVIRATATVGTGAAAVTSGSTASRAIEVISGCLLDTHCTGAAGICDTSSNACVRCLDNGDCATGAVCQAQSCTLSPPSAQAPAAGSATNNATPVFSGTAVPGAIVTVRVDGTSIGTAVADESGMWSLPSASALAPGVHAYTLTAQVGAGASVVQSSTTAPLSFTVTTGCLGNGDCGAPFVCKTGDGICVRCVSGGDCPTGATCNANACALAAPTITAPTAGSVTNVPRPTFTGTAVPGATVTLTINGSTILVTTADTSGMWQTAPSIDLPVGSYTAVASATIGAGSAAVTSPATQPVAFEEVQGCLSNAGCSGATPVCDTNTGVCVRCLMTSQCPSGATCLAQACTLPVPTITTPSAGTPLSGTSLVVAGTAAPGATVTIIIDGQPVGTAVSDGQGTFTFTLPMGLMPGAHTIAVSASVGSGGSAVSSGTSVPATVQVINASPDAGVGMDAGGMAMDGGMVPMGDAGMMTMGDGGVPNADSGMMAAPDGGVAEGDAPMSAPDAMKPPVVPPGMVCSVDTDCGGAESGIVCDNQSGTCVAGCRANGGNMCPGAVVCSSSGTEIGTCNYDQRYAVAGGGCQIGGSGGASGGGFAWLAFAAVGMLMARRRRLGR